MDQEYDKWNVKKKAIARSDRVYFDKGEIWYASIGKNIGDEEDGKNESFERPILIIRKFNHNIFLCVPLTSNTDKESKYYHRLTSFKDSVAILSQIRLLDARRLLRLMGKINSSELKEIKSNLAGIV